MVVTTVVVIMIAVVVDKCVVSGALGCVGCRLRSVVGGVGFRGGIGAGGCARSVGASAHTHTHTCYLAATEGQTSNTNCGPKEMIK